MNEKQFYYWQRRVREEVYKEQVSAAEPKQVTTFVEVPPLSKIEEALEITQEQYCRLMQGIEVIAKKPKSCLFLENHALIHRQNAHSHGAMHSLFLIIYRIIVSE